MFDPSLDTYAVSLVFPPEISVAVASAARAVATAAGSGFYAGNKVPPHVTIGAFHAAKKDEEKLVRRVQDFAESQRAGTVLFTKTGDFNGKTLFLKPEKNGFLLEINAALHSRLLAEFEEGENGYYMPEVWIPHAALATRLSQRQFEKAVQAAKAIKLPIEAEIRWIALHHCSPFKELRKIKLGC